MGDLSNFRGRVSRLGDVKSMTLAGPALLIDDSIRWLRTGKLIAYGADYAPLLVDQPGLLVTAYPARVSSYNQANYANLGVKFLRAGSKNWQIDGGVSGDQVGVRYSADGSLTFATNAILGATDYLVGAYGAFAIGSNVVVFGSADTNQTGCTYSANGAIFAAPTGLPTGSTVSIACGAASASLGVILRADTPGANGAGFYTTTDGSSFTNRTGTGGTNGSISSMHWSQAGARFLYVVGTAALNSTTDGYTQTALTLPANVSFVQGDTWGKRFASSASASLFLLADGRVLRTTDGVAFTAIDPTNGGLQASVGAQAVIGYDPTNTRFVIAINAGGTAAPAFLFSDDQGLTWQMSTAFEDFHAGTSVANAPRVMGFGEATVSGTRFIAAAGPASGGGGDRLFDITGMAMRTPSFVGTYRASKVMADLEFPHYLRVK